jgi:hypothetical protein
MDTHLAHARHEVGRGRTRNSAINPGRANQNRGYREQIVQGLSSLLAHYPLFWGLTMMYSHRNSIRPVARRFRVALAVLFVALLCLASIRFAAPFWERPWSGETCARADSIEWALSLFIGDVGLGKLAKERGCPSDSEEHLWPRASVVL